MAVVSIEKGLKIIDGLEYREVWHVRPEPEGTTVLYVRKYREVVDGVEYNVSHMLHPNGNVTRSYDPVRTPEQQAKRDETLRQAAAAFARACIREKGIEWAREHLAVDEAE